MFLLLGEMPARLVMLAFVGMFLLVVFSFGRAWRRHGEPDDEWPPRRYREKMEKDWERAFKEAGRSDESTQSQGWTCRQANCRAMNPAHGRYCRRCGQQRA